MPLITASRAGRCAGCGGRIPRGERIEYTTETGARHLTCTDGEESVRTNRHARPCEHCGASVAPGAGRLTGRRVEQAGVWSTRWAVRCADIGACLARIRGQ